MKLGDAYNLGKKMYDAYRAYRKVVRLDPGQQGTLAPIWTKIGGEWHEIGPTPIKNWGKERPE